MTARGNDPGYFAAAKPRRPNSGKAVWVGGDPTSHAEIPQPVGSEEYNIEGCVRVRCPPAVMAAPRSSATREQAATQAWLKGMMTIAAMD
jgi:hypothetical protein